MSEQKTETSDRHLRDLDGFLPDPEEIPRTIFWSICLLAYAILAGIAARSPDLGFVVGLGAACGLGIHRIAVRGDWALRFKIPRR